MKDKKLCPFKIMLTRKGVPLRGSTTVIERFADCAGERCMAYQDGKCARLAQGGKRND